MMRIGSSLWMVMCLLSVCACGVAGDARDDAEISSTAQAVETHELCPDQQNVSTFSVNCEITERDGSVVDGFKLCRETCTTHFRVALSPPRCEVVSSDCDDPICGVCIAFR